MDPWTTYLILTTGIAAHLYLAWLLVRALIAQRREWKHHNDDLRTILKRPAQAEALHAALCRTPDEPALEESLKAVTLGQRVLGVIVILGLGLMLAACFSDL
jgi:hypothetical protein